jgi:hypothetical protein
MKRTRRVCQSCWLSFALACMAGAARSTAAANVMNYYVTEDTYVDARYTTRNFGVYGGTKVFINKAAAGQSVPGEPARALIDLPDTLVSALGSTLADNLVSVKLWVCNYGSQSPGTRAFELHPLTRSFVEGTENGTTHGTGATWNTYNGVDSWTTAGGDYDATHHIDVYRQQDLAWYAFDITSMLNDPADPNGTRYNLLSHGLLLKIDESNPNGTWGHNFASSDNDDPACRSYFEVTTVPEPATIVMLASGLGAAALLSMRHRKKEPRSCRSQ